MDHRPIGVFDSGLGGLTSLRALRDAAPREAALYFGDSARVPYGGRGVEEITRFSRQNAAFLRSRGVKAVLMACNTTASNCLELLRRENPDLLFMGPVEPSAAAAVKATRSGRIAVIATEATVRSGAYQRALRAALPGAEIFALGCPKLVPLVEAGRVRPGDAAIEDAVAEYLESLRRENIDTLVLGCTHYPLFSDVIARFMGPDVTLIDSGREAALALLEELKTRDALGETGGIRYFTSGDADSFAEKAGFFMGGSLQGAVEQIDIEAY